jgi:hypothetical protein
MFDLILGPRQDFERRVQAEVEITRSSPLLGPFFGFGIM